MEISSATYHDETRKLVKLTFDDGSRFAIYPEDGSEDTYADILLRDWLAQGNTIADPE